MLCLAAAAAGAINRLRPMFDVAASIRLGYDLGSSLVVIDWLTRDGTKHKKATSCECAQN